MGGLDNSRDVITTSRRWVVKIGSSLVTNDGAGLDVAAIESWCAQCAALRAQGIELVLVCSGAVAEGITRLGWASRPAGLAELQAAAAVGQMGVVRAWERGFAKYDIRTAQVLLTHEDLANRSRYLNARNTLQKLLSLGVVAVINENDTVAIEEISLGDNDTLGALVANIIDAELLVILTDQDGLFDADPRHNPNAKLIAHASPDDPAILEMAGGGGVLGRGGMRTKITAAQTASQSGCATTICNGRLLGVMERLKAGEVVGTLLSTDKPSLPARKLWLASQTQVAGSVTIDDGAKSALLSGGNSLLPVGVVAVVGDYRQGELVSIIDQSGRELARGLVNFTAPETRDIAGKTSAEIQRLLDGVQHDELVHLDNLVLLS